MNTLMSIILLSIATLALAAPNTEPASAATRVQAQEPDRVQIERRFESVGTLLERSSAARQIEASGDAPAKERHAHARQIYQQAQDAYRTGDLAKASGLLSDASVAMFEAVKLAAPEKVTAQKVQNDFNNKVESVKALLAAQRRISSEKPEVAGTQETAKQVQYLLAEAQRLAAAGEMTAARSTLERAYLMAKASVSSMRSGDTLVRSLHFASKEEEYRYELDRNDTHQMLIKVLLEEKRGSPSLDGMVKGFLERAGSLRGQAESSASRHDYGDAIQLLENSTAELVKAIRNAGVYIPG